MNDSFPLENAERTVSSVQLVYGVDPLSLETNWLNHIDRCTQLVMEYKEDQLLAGIDWQKQQELFEMESVGFVAFEDEDDLDEE